MFMMMVVKLDGDGGRDTSSGSYDEITMNTSFSDDLEADSLDLVELIMAIEDEFNLSVEDEEVENIKTVGDVVNFIADHQ